MTPGLTRFLQASACGVILILTGCTTTGSGPVAITKVNPYHLQDKPLVRSEDQMLDFEQTRYFHGVVEDAEKKDLHGNYFTIFWKSESRSPVTVRLEYRQGSTGSKIHAQEVAVSQPKRSNVTKFRITGSDYERQGKVTQWKASIVENGVVLAEYKSYLWH
jgi:outer membrane biogenesis lipoprotein LolB